LSEKCFASVKPRVVAFLGDMEEEIRSAKYESRLGRHLALNAVARLRDAVVAADEDVIIVAFLAGSLFGNKKLEGVE